MVRRRYLLLLLLRMVMMVMMVMMLLMLLLLLMLGRLLQRVRQMLSMRFLCSGVDRFQTLVDGRMLVNIAVRY